jgi:hypothetical protein
MRRYVDGVPRLREEPLMALRLGYDKDELPHSHPADPINAQGVGAEPQPARAGLVTNAGVLVLRATRGWLKGSPLGLTADGALAVCAQATTGLLRALGSRPDHDSITQRGAEPGVSGERMAAEGHASARARRRHRGD